MSRLKTTVIDNIQANRSTARENLDQYVTWYLVDLKQEDLMEDLRELFLFISNEAKEYRKNHSKGKAYNQLKGIIEGLNIIAENTKSVQSFVESWQEWENKVNPASEAYGSKELPTAIVLKGYFLLEDFREIKRHIIKNNYAEQTW